MENGWHGACSRQCVMIKQQIYDIFIEFEHRSAAIYSQLSTKCTVNPGLTWFFVEMATDEKRQAGTLEYCRDNRMFSDRLPDAGQIQRLGSLFKEIANRMFSENIDVDGAFEVAIALETSDMNDIYDGLTETANALRNVNRSKTGIATCDRFERLHAAAVRFGAATAIQNVLHHLAEASVMARYFGQETSAAAI